MIATLPERGLVILYTPGEPTACPACTSRQWIIGRFSVQCFHCEAAFPLAPPVMGETSLVLQDDGK